MSPAARRRSLLAALWLAAGPLAAQGEPGFARELDRFVRRGMAEWQVPGLSVAVVQDDRTVFLRGYGVRRVDAPEPVDPATLFGIMSTTKAMTAFAVALLVDEGRLDWDDPVSRWVPEFAMPDPYVTADLRVRDLLTHSAGLGGADLLWTRGDLAAAEIFRRLRGLEPAYPLRGGFAYQNVMYGLAGEVIARASGMSWAEFLRRRLFNPLGMTRTYATLGLMRQAADPNVSAPHYRIRDTVRVIGEDSVDPIPAAGAVWSTAEDMALWARFLLDSARVGGRRLLGEAGFAMLFSPQVVIPPGEFYVTQRLTRPRWRTYGLGWFQQDYRGEFVAFHTGSLAGRTAIIGLLPAQRTAVVVLGNLDHAEVRHAIMLKVFDLVLGAPERDWNGELRALYREREEAGAAAETARLAGRVEGTAPSLPLAAYAGRYVHPVWGDLDILLADGGLQFRLGTSPDLRGPLSHFHYDTFLAALGDGRDPPPLVQFRPGPDGAVAGLDLPDFGITGFVRAP